MFPPSSGSGTILNYDIVTEMDKIRPFLGLCPQDDILYDNLLVEENLKFICLVRFIFSCQLLLMIIFRHFLKL
jgi:ABC-type multidrug transport system ATPase subunit